MKYLSHKIEILKRDFREKGLRFVFKRIILFLFRPFGQLVIRNKGLLEFFYRTLPNLRDKLPFLKLDPGKIEFPKSDLIHEVRYFWYANIPDRFDLDGEKITRSDIFIYGGPNPKITCPVCQKREWLSRVRQKNLFVEHSCPSANKVKIFCSCQGDEHWTNLHQNFDFSLGCDEELPAPKCLCVFPEDKKSEAGGFYQRFQTPGCDQWMLVFRRRLAFVCQVEVVKYPRNINWSKYDFLFIPNTGTIPKFSRPNIPVVLYGHDFWPLHNKGFQWTIDWLQPDVLLTPYPAQWKKYLHFPPHTKIVFYPFFESLFFSRPNLGRKKIDLLVIGSLNSPLYKERVLLDKQVAKLADKYKIEFSHSLPLSASWQGGTTRKDPVSKKIIYYLNKWSEYLGSAKYVVFGKMKYPILVSKYYEVLGSGAVPIFPEVPDLKLLKVKAFEHYIPLSEIEGKNKNLTYFLDRYPKFQHIAKNAVEWYKKVSEKMLFEDFESLIREITNYKYPKRLI